MSPARSPSRRPHAIRCILSSAAMYSIAIDRSVLDGRAPDAEEYVVLPYRVAVNGARLFILEACLSEGAARRLLGRASSSAEDRASIERALARWAIRYLERGLADGVFPYEPLADDTPAPVKRLEPSANRSRELRHWLTAKTCGFQQRGLAGMLCAASSSDDETMVGSSGLTCLAKTSQPTCDACDMPDAELLCSHMTHPNVHGLRSMGAPFTGSCMRRSASREARK